MSCSCNPKSFEVCIRWAVSLDPHAFGLFAPFRMGKMFILELNCQFFMITTSEMWHSIASNIKTFLIRKSGVIFEDLG
jgi:hypothetical protein